MENDRQIAKIIGSNIRKIRKELIGKSMEDTFPTLSEKNISRYETGKNEPSFSVGLEICAALGCDPKNLLEEELDLSKIKSVGIEQAAKETGLSVEALNTLKYWPFPSDGRRNRDIVHAQFIECIEFLIRNAQYTYPILEHLINYSYYTNESADKYEQMFHFRTLASDDEMICHEAIVQLSQTMANMHWERVTSNLRAMAKSDTLRKIAMERYKKTEKIKDKKPRPLETLDKWRMPSEQATHSILKELLRQFKEKIPADRFKESED